MIPRPLRPCAYGVLAACAAWVAVARTLEAIGQAVTSIGHTDDRGADAMLAGPSWHRARS